MKITSIARSALFLAAFVAAPKLPAQNAPRILGMAHMAYYVSDLKQARDYYEGFLGFQEAFTLKNADGTDHVVFIKINDHQFIELYNEPVKNYGFIHDAGFETNDAKGIRDHLVGDRMMATLGGFFGVLAALLVVVGLYGVLSFFITRRRAEIGIRIALGAGRWQVIGLVMRDTAAMLLFGVILGTFLALLAGRAASSMLFGLKAYDIATFAFAIFLLAAIAALASWLPALKASRLDPVAALRAE